MKFLINNAFKMSRPLRGLDISKALFIRNFIFLCEINFIFQPWPAVVTIL